MPASPRRRSGPQGGDVVGDGGAVRSVRDDAGDPSVPARREELAALGGRGAGLDEDGRVDTGRVEQRDQVSTPNGRRIAASSSVRNG
jgi:hypothetical protein